MTTRHDIEFRLASESDAPVYASLMASVASPINLVETDPEKVRELIKSLSVLKIYCANEFVGILSYEAQADGTTSTAYIEEFAIHPDNQGKGIGQVALEEAICLFGWNNFRKVTLHTHPDNRALHLYLRCGFQISATVENYRGSGTPRLFLEHSL